MPYSHFRVGACILTESGETFKGCNFENASYGAAICAERCAASCAIAAGQRRFKAIAIAAERTAAWPCGICRQVLREFGDLSMPVDVGQRGQGFRVKTLGELLPESFGPEIWASPETAIDPAPPFRRARTYFSGGRPRGASNVCAYKEFLSRSFYKDESKISLGLCRDSGTQRSTVSRA